MSKAPAPAVVVHAEDPTMVVDASPSPRFADFVASRPAQAETRAVATAIDAARRHGARVHILHLSAAEALQYVAGSLPDLRTFRAALGLGLRLDDLGLYIAKSVTDPRTPLNFFARLQPRF